MTQLYHGFVVSQVYQCPYKELHLISQIAQNTAAIVDSMQLSTLGELLLTAPRAIAQLTCSELEAKWAANSVDWDHETARMDYLERKICNGST